MSDDSTTTQMPQPDLALKRLDRLVGAWSMEGDVVGSNENNIKGETRTAAAGGLVLEQRMKMDFMGLEIDSLVGYDPESGAFRSSVFSNLAPDPLP